jgi:putative transposase
MPRHARLDAPGTLHHVIGRGLEGVLIFPATEDREDFLRRLGKLNEAGAWRVYAWALMANHFHLLVQTCEQSLSRNMRRLLTGYVVNFNRRHHRFGHLFQNRYKSILCQDEPYLLELTRYIHLNPVRAGIVKGLRALRTYPWTGHATLVGRNGRTWQDTDTVLAHFGKRTREAIRRYEEFVGEGVGLGRRPELTGGGLIRSHGGWSEVISLRRKGQVAASDARILGEGDFVEQVLANAEARVKETLGWRGHVPTLSAILEGVAGRAGVEATRIRSGNRKRDAARARRTLCQLAVNRFGYSGAAVARFLGATTSLVNRLANTEEVPGLEKYLLRK